MEKKNQIKITVSGYDVVTTEEATKMVSEKISQLKLKSSGPIPFKTKRRLRSVPISPHKHKDSQEQFTQQTHRRVIHVFGISATDLETLEKIAVPNTANLEVKSFF